MATTTSITSTYAGEFAGKYISAADVAKKMEDRIARGVVDQNIEVNEINDRKSVG